MKSNMSLGQFRSEIGAYKHFQLLADDPLSPISISAMFDHAVVVLSASPYIALKNSVDRVCLSHIFAIKKRRKTGEIQSYIFSCNDFSLGNNPIEVRYVLNCS